MKTFQILVSYGCFFCPKLETNVSYHVVLVNPLFRSKYTITFEFKRCWQFCSIFFSLEAYDMYRFTSFANFEVTLPKAKPITIEISQ